MVIARSAARRSVCLAAVCLAIWSSAAGSRRAYGDEDDKSSLPPTIEKLLHWFPENTETVVVAQAFKLSRSKKTQADLFEPIWSRVADLSLCGLPELEASACLDELAGRDVSVAISGARDFTVVSAFGSLRFQGCSIIRLTEPLPDDGRKLIDVLREESKAVRTIAGNEVFVFPDRTAMESTIKPKKWQGQYISLPSADTLLCASSDEFLVEVLARSADVPADRALAEDLPEWKHVDVAAPVWMLRHIPRKFSGQLAAGVTWCLKPHGRNVFAVTYLPVEGQDPLPLAQIWKQPDLNARPSIHKDDDGIVKVTIDLDKEKEQLWYGFAISWSMGEIGQPQSSMNPADLLKVVRGDDSADDVEEAPNRESANLPPDCLEEVWSKQGEVYSGVAVAADGKTIAALRDRFADIFDSSGKKIRSIKLPDRRLVRWARLTGAAPGLHVFDSEGKRRWKDTSIGDVWHVTAGDLDGDGKLEVLATSAIGKVHIFNADGDEVSTLEPGTNANMVRTFRLRGDSADKIVVVGRGTKVTEMVALDAKGERLWRTDLPPGVNTCASLALASGSKWAAAGTMGSVVWLTDTSSGKTVGARPKLGMPDVTWIKSHDGRPLLLVASTRGLAAFRVKVTAVNAVAR